MSDTNIELISTISEDNKLELALREMEFTSQAKTKWSSALKPPLLIRLTWE